MMKKLEKSEYSKIEPLVRGLDRYLSIRAVMKGDVEGLIYASDKQRPDTYFVWEISGDSGFYLEGEPSENRALEINRIIRQELYTIGTASNKCVDFTLYTYPKDWKDYMAIILKDTFPRKYFRRNFLLENPNRREVKLPEGFTLTRVDKSFLDGKLYGDEHIRKWVEDPWKSRASFFEKGFGYCIHTDTEAVSWSLTDYVSDNRIEIGIHTNENYRRRGFASMVINGVVNEAIERGFDTIGWHCWGDNDASAATASRAGFIETESDEVYNAWFDEMDNLLLNGYADLFDHREYLRAVENFEGAIEKREKQGPGAGTKLLKNESGLADAYWFMGCALSMIGERDRAFGSLFKAIELVLERAKQRIELEQLKGLQEDPRWGELLAIIDPADRC